MTAAASTRSGFAEIAPMLALAGATLLWTGNFAVGSAVSAQISPFTLNFLRWTLSILLLAPFAAPLLRANAGKLRRDALWLALLGGIGVAAFQTLVYYGVAATPILNATLIIAATLALILFWTAVEARQAPSATQLLGCGLSFAGAAWLIAQGDFNRLIALDFSLGDLWMALAAATWAAYTILIRRHPPDLPPTLSLFGSMAFGLAMLAPFAIPEMIAAPPALDRIDVLGAIAYVAIGASLIAFVFWGFGVRRVGPVRAGQTLNLMPLWAAAIGVLALGQPLEPYHALGAGLVFLGVLLVNWRGAAARPA